MSYQAGELKIVTGLKPCEANGHTYEPPSYSAELGDFYLPHSCDEWIIGDRAHAELLLADLKQLLGEK